MPLHQFDRIAASDGRFSVTEAGGVLTQYRQTSALAEDHQVVLQPRCAFSRMVKKRGEMGHTCSIDSQTKNKSPVFRDPA
ncbi:MAG: hypothetical protein M3346_02025 [Actinomycetota bacterium]|nr:hypothetical protein [Actinomycetota bacterium]